MLRSGPRTAAISRHIGRFQRVSERTPDGRKRPRDRRRALGLNVLKTHLLTVDRNQFLAAEQNACSPIASAARPSLSEMDPGRPMFPIAEDKGLTRRQAITAKSSSAVYVVPLGISLATVRSPAIT